MTTLAPFQTQHARSAMVCSPDPLASSAGVAVLRAGGTAADAATAAGAVLAVTPQHLCGLGGDLFALVHRPGETVPAALNASGRAGSGADPARLRAAGHSSVPATGEIAAVPVPGCVDGWLALHGRFGGVALAEVVEHARRYAAEGFPASPTLAAAVPRIDALPEATDYAAAAPVRPGTVIRRPGVARALAAIVASGRDGFYGGGFGEGLLALGGGEYRQEDLLRPGADWVEPLGLDVWGRRVWTIPPNSQGYLTLAAAWIAERLDLPSNPADPLWAHLLVEAARQAGYDRDEVLYEGADGAALAAAERLRPRLDAIDHERAAVLPAPRPGGGTVYLCAVDEEGMGVSLIQSNFMGWGSLLIVPGVRVFLHNRGAAFSLEPGHPAEYGPGRRPPHTLSPALVTFPDGALDCVLGTMGGHSQPQILLQLLARRYGVAESPGDVIAAPRWVLAGEEGTSPWSSPAGVHVVVEGHAPAAWGAGLRARGHRVVEAPAWGGQFGHAHLIAVGDEHLAGASDPRSLAGAALGY